MDRICLLGDSAHTTTSQLGAGAGMAIEDGCVTSRLIGQTVRTAAGLEKAFRALDFVRRPGTQKLIERSRFVGQLWAFEAGDNLDKLRLQVEETCRWLWHEDLEAELDEAMKSMQ